MIFDLIDVFVDQKKLIVWLKHNGKNFFLEDDFKSKFYFIDENKEKIIKELKKIGVFSYPFIGRDFYSKKLLDVTCVEVKNNFVLNKCIEKINEISDYDTELFNTDISIEQKYFFENKVAPMVRVNVSFHDNKINTIFPIKNDSYEIIFPNLKKLEIEIGLNKEIEWIRCNEKYFRGSEKKIISDFIDYYNYFDADLVISFGGDKWLIDYLLKLSKKYSLKLNFGRFCDNFSKVSGKSYFTYGRVIRKHPKKIFKGRIHFDAETFMYEEGNIDGTYELAKTTYMPLQLAIRKSPGASISNLQMFVAYQLGFLVPTKKNTPEKYKSALRLLKVDKGGFIYTPKIGFFENVIEVDYSSLYPSIMVLHNISPETLFCSCCDNKIVPDGEYNICQKQVGLIPLALKDLLKKRLYFKHKKRNSSSSEKEKYSRMSNSLKWLLVTCFGYTGYRNARFGRIEAHESITAFARDKLLIAAKEAEKRDFEVLHGIVDSLWITKKEFSIKEVDDLIKTIKEKSGIEICLEGFLRWIVFLPSINNEKETTLNHFYGVYNTGEIKVRGIAMRRSDAPKIVKKMQEEQINIFAKAKNKKEFFESIPLVIQKLKDYIFLIENELIPLDIFEINRVVSKELKNYKGNSAQKIVLTKLKEKGVTVNPGERINYYIRNSKSKNPLNRYSTKYDSFEIDKEKYIDILIKSTEEILKPFSYDFNKLKRMVYQGEQKSLVDYEEFFKIESFEFV